MSILFYKRPSNVPIYEGPLAACEKAGGVDCARQAIPPELSFERVICNKCQSPCSLQDFLDYLTYISHDAENLQFYLWMIDYFQRFRNAASRDRALAPKWTGQPPPLKERQGAVLVGTKNIDRHSEDVTNLSRSASSSTGGSAGGAQSAEFTDEYVQTLDQIKFSISPVKDQRRHQAKNQSVDTSHESKDQMQWQPVSEQPFRSEINRIIEHYILPGSPRQLHLSQQDRTAVLHALEYTTHPSAFGPVKRMLDSTLRNQSHPNFVRWSICNNNRQWTWALRIFAITNITIGFIIAIVLILSRASRYYRILAAIEWWFGITNIIAASQGLCVLLHRMHTRQHHAWETKAEDGAAAHDDPDDDRRHLRQAVDGDDFYNVSYDSTRAQWPVKMEVFGPANSYSGEPWVSAYSRKSWYKKLFEKRIKVQEVGLSTIQNKMIRQAEAWALIITIPLTVGFVAIPNANLF